MSVTIRPDSGGTYGALQVGGVDVLKFGSGASGDPLEVAKKPDIATALNATGSAPMFAARAWVNFTGTGTVVIRGSGNVSSITDNGVGDYTVNMSTALQDVNFACEVTARSTQNSMTTAHSHAVSSVRVTTVSGPGTGTGISFNLADSDVVSVTIYR